VAFDPSTLDRLRAGKLRGDKVRGDKVLYQGINTSGEPLVFYQ